MISCSFPAASPPCKPAASLQSPRCSSRRAGAVHEILIGVRRSSRGRSCTASISSAQDEWLQKLPDKKKPLYSHSLPCTEAWLRSLGFVQSNEDRATWTIQRSDWHARLSLDLTDLFIRYLKSGPGNLDRDIERKFSYALSREDLENAILGGP